VDSTNEPQDTIVLSTERHLKWEALDAVERALMWLSGLLLFTFTTAVLVDVVTRTIGIPVVWLQEVTLGTFVWGVFIGGAVAVRRNEHFLLARIGIRDYQPPGPAWRRPLPGLFRVCFLLAGLRHLLPTFRDAAGRHNRVHPYLRLTDSPVHHREARQRVAPRLRSR
jgi:hypothetical protein